MKDYIGSIRKQRRDNVIASLSNKTPVEKKQTQELPIPNNWVRILEIAKSTDVPAPVFSGNSLGHKLLDHALERCVRAIVDETNISYREVQARIIDELQSNLVAKKTALSSIKFLRNTDASIFLDCPDCGTENEPGWEFCTNCQTKKR